MNETKVEFFKKAFMKEVDDFVDDRLQITGAFVESEAVLRCPVGKYPHSKGRVGGRLRGSLTWAIFGKSSRVRQTGKPSAQADDGVPVPTEKGVVRIGSSVEYAPYVEHDQEFIRKAVYENKKDIMRIWKTL